MGHVHDESPVRPQRRCGAAHIGARTTSSWTLGYETNRPDSNGIHGESGVEGGPAACPMQVQTAHHTSRGARLDRSGVIWAEIAERDIAAANGADRCVYKRVSPIRLRHVSVRGAAA